MRVEPEALDQLLHPVIDPKSTPHVIAKGLPALPGLRLSAKRFLMRMSRRSAGRPNPFISDSPGDQTRTTFTAWTRRREF